jgi:Golgi nucleoside diphosphatase
MQFQIGHAAYNRAECIDTVVLGERCTPTPNTHQPYIRFRVAKNTSTPSSPSLGGVALHNQWSGKCLQTMGQDRDNGSTVNIWDCTGTSNQVWALSDKGELRNGWSGKCLQTMGQDRDNGSTVNIWDCTGTSNQLWEQTSSGEFRNRWSSRCLQTLGQDRDNGSTVNIWDCTGTSNQSWR